MNDKTRRLLDAAKARRKNHLRQVPCILEGTKEGEREQRRLIKKRKTIAAHLREIRQSDGHHLARVWARAGGC